VQRHVLYLGEINDTQGMAWRRGRSRFWRTAPRNLARCRCFRRTAVKDCCGRLDRRRQAVGIAAAPAAAVRRVLVGAAAVAGAAA
jgi:hypothetical protein